jgi:hypothetical protein
MTAACTFNFNNIVTRVEDATEAKSLPSGVFVGDTCGGRSFTDNVAAVLESRSFAGWREVQDGQQSWTIILLAK